MMMMVVVTVVRVMMVMLLSSSRRTKHSHPASNTQHSKACPRCTPSRQLNPVAHRAMGRSSGVQQIAVKKMMSQGL